MWESNCIFSLTKATACVLLVLLYLASFSKSFETVGVLLCYGYGMILQYGGKEFSFPYSSLFHPIWSSFSPDWNGVGICINLVSSSLLVNSPIMLFFTYFPSKLISHHTHIKQKVFLAPTHLVCLSLNCLISGVNQWWDKEIYLI